MNESIPFLPKPAQIVGDEVMIVAAGTGDDDDAALVRVPVDEFLHATRTFLTREGEEKFRRHGGQWHAFGLAVRGGGGRRRRRGRVRRCESRA